MGELFVLAALLGRPASAPTSIALAAAIMTGINPLVVQDISFQLSFAAILGVIYIAPILQTHGQELLQRAGIEAEAGIASALVESMSVTIGAVLTTTPLIALQFGRVSMIAPLPNLLLVPEYPLIVVSAALAALATLVWAPLGEVAGWFAWVALTYMVQVVRFFASLPLASLEFDGFGRWHAAAAYAALAAFVWWFARRRAIDEPAPARRPGVAIAMRPAWVVAGGLAIVAGSFWWAALQGEARGRLTVEVLDVGQGDAILIETPDGQHILVDGGASGLALEQRLGEELPFWERTIDLVALTHPQQDHIGGLIDVLRDYDVDEALGTPMVASSAAYQEWRALIASKQIPYHEALAGESIDLGSGATLRVLGPDAGSFASSDMNDTSLVLKISWDSVSFLLTGDIQSFGEAALIDSGADLQATALKVPHHGSITSSTAAFLDAVQPQVAVVSVGANNPYHHPSPDVIDRLQDYGSLVQRTDEEGTVSMSTDGQHLWIETQRGP
jgi:competence protein ComEC